MTNERLSIAGVGSLLFLVAIHFFTTSIISKAGDRVVGKFENFVDSTYEKPFQNYGGAGKERKCVSYMLPGCEMSIPLAVR